MRTVADHNTVVISMYQRTLNLSDVDGTVLALRTIAISVFDIAPILIILLQSLANLNTIGKYFHSSENRKMICNRHPKIKLTVCPL